MARLAVLIVLATLGVSAVPIATANGCTNAPMWAAAVCTWEHHGGGTCDEGSDDRLTQVTVHATVAYGAVTGASSCAGSGGTTTRDDDHVSAFANAGPTGSVTVAWTRNFRAGAVDACDMSVDSSHTGHRRFDCPAGGPPSLPWGTLLP